MKQDFKGSIPLYDKAIALNPSYVEAWFNRGVSKGNLAMHQEAIDDYSNAIKLNKKFAPAYYLRAVSEINLNKFTEGCEDLQQAKALGYAAADELIAIHCPKTETQK
jgi:tetratricopeptide (TPR) repeat protein